MVLLRIYDDQNNYLGFLMTGFNFPNMCFISPGKASFNVKQHRFKAGTYKVSMVWIYKEEDLDFPEIDCVFDEEAINRASEYETFYFSDDNWEIQENLEDEITDPKYYKGDLHGHTMLSDGTFTFDQVDQACKREFLDYMAITDHNLIAMGIKRMETYLLPSFELTLPEGHINIHGLENLDLFMDMDSVLDFDLNDYLSKHKARCHIAINHPFFKPWNFSDPSLDISRVDSMELMCDPNYPGSQQATEKALAFFDFLWKRKL